MSAQTSAVQTYTPREFHRQAHDALGNPQIRGNFRKAMDGLMAKRRDVSATGISRPCASSVPTSACARWPSCPNCSSGWKPTARPTASRCTGRRTATRRAGSSARSASATAKAVIKGKSMVSEEIELNHPPGRAGIEALESDMGEYIVQLNQQTPFPHHHAGDPQDQAEIAAVRTTRRPRARLHRRRRRADRQRPRRAARALHGRRHRRVRRQLRRRRDRLAVLVENEGNGRMCTAVPPVHIAVTGIEKVVEQLEHVPPLFSAADALGHRPGGDDLPQRDHSARAATGELDGPKEVHLVLLDNGRSQAYATTSFAPRCSASAAAPA
jgi:L-lactate dehydrogenase complex protein LldF